MVIIKIKSEYKCIILFFLLYSKILPYSYNVCLYIFTYYNSSVLLSKLFWTNIFFASVRLNFEEKKMSCFAFKMRLIPDFFFYKKGAIRSKNINKNYDLQVNNIYSYFEIKIFK